MDGTSAESAHELLLALAGRVDDDLLAWGRELVAVGEAGRAVELLAAGLVADRVALPAGVRAALVDAARAARTHLDADAALAPPGEGAGTDHRFTTPGVGDPVATALRDLPERLLDGARVRLARRLTPAGAASGPVPHPVVLVETRPGNRPPDVLAYQLAVALDRAGAPAAVEVLVDGGSRTAYHLEALRVAEPVRGGPPERDVLGDPEPEGPPPGPAASPFAETPFPTPAPWAVHGPGPDEGGEPHPVWGAWDAPEDGAHDGGPVEPRPVRRLTALPTTRPHAQVVPLPEPAPRPVPRSVAGPAVPVNRVPLPEPVPLVRRSSPVRPLTPVRDERGAADAPAPHDPPRTAPDPPRAAPPGAAAARPDDPLGGPRPVVDGPGAPPAQPAPSGPPVDERWSEEWLSGEWAMPAGPAAPATAPADAAASAPTGSFDSTPWDEQPGDGPRAEGPADRPDDGDRAEPDDGSPGARRTRVSTTDRFLAVPPSHDGPVDDDPGPDSPRRRHRYADDPPPPPERGAQPGSGARLSDADRELLARLQAELADGRRPRMSRRAGVGEPHGGNGHHPGPPDLAG